MLSPVPLSCPGPTSDPEIKRTPAWYDPDMTGFAPRPVRPKRGPHRAEDLRPKQPYELSEGHRVLCLPTGGRGSRANFVGAEALGTDPSVREAGVDAGYTPEASTLRAPDIAVGNVPDQPGWVKGVPPLAVEYADTGQDEAELQKKITEMLRAGTRLFWVVRLSGQRRVEVHAPGREPHVVFPGQQLHAPDILKNPVPVEALYDQDAAHEVALRNLLQRKGFDSLEAIRGQGREEGQLAGLRTALRLLLRGRNLLPGPEEDARIEATRDAATLERWLQQAITAGSAAEALR